jgi:tripartite-type tricarboxylate transporter receptor subunit TctC
LSDAALCAVFPGETVRVLVGFTPGAGADIAIRLIAPKMGETLGQQIVVDNRPAPAATSRRSSGRRAPADGYTLFAAGAPAAISQTLYSKLSYDLLKDFEAVALLASVPQLMVVHPSLPAGNVKEFVAIAKRSRDPLTFASTGNGSSPQMTAELLRLNAGIALVHVPYKGTPQAFTDLLAGQVTFMFANVLSAVPHVQGGRLRALAITSLKRSAIMPKMPAVAETYPRIRVRKLVRAGGAGGDLAGDRNPPARCGDARDAVAGRAREVRGAGRRALVGNAAGGGGVHAIRGREVGERWSRLRGREWIERLDGASRVIMPS